MKQENNLPAFPCDNIHDDKGNWHNTSGMSLRDYFAAKAMQGVLSSEKLQTFNFERISIDSYAMADAMLKARES